jgi:hypothetical protein
LIKKIRQKMVQFRVYAKNGDLKEIEEENSWLEVGITITLARKFWIAGVAQLAEQSRIDRDNQQMKNK